MGLQLFLLHISEFNYVEEVKGFTVSHKGGAQLVDQRNFTYSLNKKAGMRIFWKCHKYRGSSITSCKAGALTYENYILKFNGVHNHDPDNVEIVKRENDFWLMFFIFIEINIITKIT